MENERYWYAVACLVLIEGFTLFYNEWIENNMINRSNTPIEEIDIVSNKLNQTKSLP